MLLADGDTMLDWPFNDADVVEGFKDLPLPNTFPPPKVLLGMIYQEDENV